MDQNFENIKRGAKSVGRGINKGVKRGIKRASQRVVKGSSKALKQMFKALPSHIKLVVIGAFALLIMLGMLYFSTDSSIGETGNLVDNNNTYSSSSSSSSKSSFGSSSSVGHVSGSSISLADAIDNTSGSSDSTTSDAAGSSSVSSSVSGEDVVEYALQFVGNPYVYGGESLTNGADCSGFVMSVYAHFGISLDRTAAEQSLNGVAVTEDNLKAGDLCFYMGDNGIIGHVSIYMGNGQVVHSSNARTGIKISDYGYRKPCCWRRIVDGESSALLQEYIADGRSINFSSANAACLSYYNMVSTNKSTWQLLDDGTLIRNDETGAVSDYFGNDKDFYISPYLLYAMNYYLWGKDYTYPEAFLKPVAYDDSYNLLPLADDNTVSVTSSVRDENGNETSDTMQTVSDYGIASVFHYTTADMVKEYRGHYYLEDVYDDEADEIVQEEIDENYSISVSSTTYNILDWVLSFSGKTTYTYTPTSVLTSRVSDGESADENDNVTKILYDTITVYRYLVITSNGEELYIKDFDEALSYVGTHSGSTLDGAVEEEYEYLPEGATSTDATEIRTRVVDATQYEFTYDLYKYRDSSSGLYTDFVDQGGVNSEDYGNDYLKDYLKHFSTYKPSTIDRDTEIFTTFSSSVTENLVENSSAVIVGEGNNIFEQYYNGSSTDLINTVWDTFVSYGYSEQQAAAILGNMYGESKFNTSVTNSIGAFGLCQWFDRKQKLFDYAAAIGEDVSNYDVQIKFAFMELDRNNSYPYANCQWTPSYAQSYSEWVTSSDVPTLTLAMCLNWERPFTPNAWYSGNVKPEEKQNVADRIAFAEQSYAALSGRTPTEALIIDGASSGVGSSTSQVVSTGNSVTVNDQQKLNLFYAEADKVDEGTELVSYYEKGLTEADSNNVLLLASSLIRGEDMESVRLDLGNELWEEGYIASVSDLNNAKTFAGVSGEYTIAEVEELSDINFLFPVADMGSSITLSSRFGARSVTGGSSNHKGLDVSVAEGSTLVACADGTIKETGYDNSRGNYILISHGTTSSGLSIETYHYHLSEVSVKAGDTVTAGQTIGKTGNTGASTGPHLHICLVINGTYYNPVYMFDTSNSQVVADVMNNGNISATTLILNSKYGYSGFTENIYWNGSAFVSQ